MKKGSTKQKERKEGGRGGGKKIENRKEKERKKSWDQVFRQKELLWWD